MLQPPRAQSQPAPPVDEARGMGTTHNGPGITQAARELRALCIDVPSSITSARSGLANPLPVQWGMT